MNFDQLPIKLQEAVSAAQGEAMNRQNSTIESLHLLKRLLDVDMSKWLLKKNGVNVPRLQTNIENTLQRLPRVTGNAAQPYPANNFTETIHKAQKFAKQNKDFGLRFVEYPLLKAILETGGDAGQLLKDEGLTAKGLEKAITECAAVLAFGMLLCAFAKSVEPLVSDTFLKYLVSPKHKH